MKKYIMGLLLGIFVLFAYSGNAEKRTADKSTIEYLSVDEVFSRGNKLKNKQVFVKGEIEHVCKHSGKRFRIKGRLGNELKIELSNDVEPLNSSVIGRTVEVIGKLIPMDMSLKDMNNWKKRAMENHKGEENTLHYKDEISTIDSIIKVLEIGKTPYYRNYYVKCKSFTFK